MKEAVSQKFEESDQKAKENFSKAKARTR